MLYAIFCYNDETMTSAWSKEEDEACMARLLAVQEPLKANRKLGPVARLLPTTAATTLRKTKDEPIVIDGPFAETKEQLLGFYVVDVASLDEALDYEVYMQEAAGRTEDYTNAVEAFKNKQKPVYSGK